MKKYEFKLETITDWEIDRECIMFLLVLHDLSIVSWDVRHYLADYWRKTYGSKARIRDKNRSKLLNEVNDRV